MTQAETFDLASDIYPDGWDEFIGQDKAKRQLIVACQSAKMRGEPLAHTLIASGEPGIGKTTLALLTAGEMETELRIVSGQIGANEARILLSTMRDGDVLFYEEMHQAVARGKASAEWLLTYMTDGVILGPRGAEVQPRVTIIGATTDAARLPDTILHRFPTKPVLEPYTDKEAAEIGSVMAVKVFAGGELPFPSFRCFKRIARAGNNNPRTIGNILHNLRDVATVDLDHVHDGSEYDLTEALTWMGLTPDGLTETAVRYLIVLLEEFQAQAGERALCDFLQEPNLDSVERLLMRKEYITKTRTGRVLTSKGIKRANELKDQL